MHKLYIVVALLLSLLLIILFAPQTHAVSSSLLIYQVQAGGVSAGSDDKAVASREFVSIYNNSDTDIDISNWCLTNKTGSVFACFNPVAANETLHLPGHKYATISSDNFVITNNFRPNVNFITTNKTSGSIIAGSDTISLIDPDRMVIDSVGWTSTLSGGNTLKRQFNTPGLDIMLDTDNNSDFQKLNSLDIPASGVEE